ncbi:TIGR02265 family protein [Corallococcus sp. H22C18031201]|uniref:DUF2378 family protein n=1 Tax=Citreicoccus inhibens TaxID=2849499 RepID=UPI000E764741|nr:DUF2378 family protein [Citreicoccus inhibens]MBU8898779.1 DUF2378 family protein [Citreicoccus inhibens]RJS24151.1 TIGR02265 family protein [Corallococcus sp. H22C18031201]
MESPERVVFQQSFEGLIRALGSRMDDDCVQRLRQVGIDPIRPLAVAYPLEVWVGALREAAATLAPQAPLDEAAALVGHRFLHGYGGTLIGRALLTGVRLLGPQRMLERMTRNLRTGTNYLEAHLEQQGPTHYVLTCRPVVIVGFYVGLFSAGLEISGAQQPVVRVLSTDGDTAVYDLTWT